MFDLYGMKWPRSFEFVAVQKAVSELKVSIFSIGILLTLFLIILGVLYNADFEAYATFNFVYTIGLLLLSSWAEDYPKFSCFSIFASTYVVVLVSVNRTTELFINEGASLYTVFNVCIWVYSLFVFLMAMRLLIGKRT